jgi:hypothetical protein
MTDLGIQFPCETSRQWVTIHKADFKKLECSTRHLPFGFCCGFVVVLPRPSIPDFNFLRQNCVRASWKVSDVICDILDWKNRARPSVVNCLHITPLQPISFPPIS